ncbi:MAG: response regulator [Candidatus Latescibacterota bacterium]|nr:MAG: response regulator [Candidatus Latescibacterota bacterium]
MGLRPGEDQGSERRIVVVDDDELSRYVVARRLQRWGFEPMVFASPSDALHCLRDEGVSALISDVYMPEADGLSLARAVRLRRPDLPVLLMTADPAPELVERARAEGVRAVITKQAGSDRELRSALERALDDAGAPSVDLELAHSLRTPLTALKSAIDILDNSDLRYSDRRFVGIAQRNVDQMIVLVERLLDRSGTRH